MRRMLLVAPLLTLLLAAQAPAMAAEPRTYVATIQTVKGRFRAEIRDPEMVEKARRELAGGEEAGIPTGPLAWGDGGVNWGHRWHVTQLSFADFTIELCDATARMVDRDPAYWVETVRYFCPWSGQVVRLEPLRPWEGDPGAQSGQHHRERAPRRGYTP